jgi:hypothetical protein
VKETAELRMFSGRELFGENTQRFSKKSTEVVKKTYDAGSLFIGVRVAVSRNCLDITVASFPGDACLL